MIKYKIILLFQLFSVMLFAQQKVITGNVVDGDGEVLPGANVIIKGTNTGTSTDFDGNYSISVEGSNVVLVFSYIGYENQEITVGNSSSINVILESAGQLEEVVVTALGIKREAKSLGYARQSLNTEGLDEARSTNFLNSLSGKVAGVSVVNPGTPTGTSRIVIRGITSVTGNNQPLYVLDGIPLSNEMGDSGVSVWNSGNAGEVNANGTTNTDLDYGSPISSINPDDIESVEILKGANAAALYGSLAANGVIIITTKKGSTKDGIGVSWNSNVAFTTNSQYPDYQYIYGSGSNGKIGGGNNWFDNATGLPRTNRHTRAYGLPMLGFDVWDYNNTVGQYLPQVGNVQEMYQTGAVYTNNISIDHAHDTGNVRLSYTNTQGEYTIDNFEKQNRHNVNLNLSQNITKKLVANVGIIYTRDNVKNRLYQNGSNRNPANSYMYLHPNMHEGNLNPYKDEDGQMFGFSGPFRNPYWNLFEISNEDTRNKYTGFVGLTWDITDEFKLSGRANADTNFVVGEEFNNMGATYDRDGLYRAFDQQSSNFNYEAILTYNKELDKTSILATAGANHRSFNQSRRQTTITSLLVPDVHSLANSNTVPLVRETDSNKKVNSVFGSVSLGYDDLIFLDLTGRNDWSSTLPADNRSYFYPAVSSSFVFSEFLNNKDILSFGKLRASYAQVGNDTSPYNLNTTYQYGGNYNGSSWLAVDSQRNNPALKPELTTSWEFGFETSFFKNRIKANLTYYKNSTIDQIIPAQVTPTMGFESAWFNAGEVANKGWEVFVQAKILKNKFKWDVDLNWSKNQSEVVELIDGVDRLLLRNWFNVSVWAEVGEPLGNIRGDIRARDPESGVSLVGNNGRILFNADQHLGNAQADWIGGLRNSFRYKQLSFSFLLDFKKGGDLYSGTALKNINFGMNQETLFGREEYFFSDTVLGENNNERRGQGLYGNDYSDSDRPKGAIYEGAAIGVRDADGNWVAQRDANGEIVYSQNWMNPQPYGYDALRDQERITYDTSYIKLREAVLAYNVASKALENTPFQSVKLSLVGRNLWTIHQNTPNGLDPEAGTTSGNGQGIEYGSFLPTRTVGLNVKLSF